MNIYAEADAIAASGAKVLVMLSRGRDSLCMARVLLDRVPRDRLTFLHLRTYQGVKYINDHLERIGHYFGTRLEIQPSRQANKMKGVKMGDFAKERDHWREFYGADFVAYGFRADESVSRSCIMKVWPDGINMKSNECYPLKRFNRAIVAHMATKYRFPLAVEYEYGFRDVGEQFTGSTAVWLHDVHPEDFQRAAQEDQNLQAEYVRAMGVPK